MLTLSEIKNKVQTLEGKWADRDRRMGAVRSVRAGDMASVYPEYFSDDNRTPMVSNFVETVARDLAEAIAPLPALNCVSGNITSDTGRKFAAKRQKIGASYWYGSNLATSMFTSADNFVTYGYAVWQVEPDFKEKAPRIRRVDVFGSYPEFDLDGDCVSFTRKWTARASTLSAQYPLYAGQLMRKSTWGQDYTDRDLTVYKYTDDKQVIVYVGDCDIVLERFENTLGVCPVVCALKPGPDDNIRGQFDDMLGVQAARSLMMRLAIDAAEKAVGAPIAAPDDMTEFNIGPDVILRSQSPEKIGRVNMSVDGSTFAEIQTLERELQVGTRAPAARNGGIQANVITGRGIQELQGGFDSQIKTAQTIIAVALRKLTAIAFQMDQQFWPNERKTIRGITDGAPFEESYTPSRDIDGDYTCEVRYGFLAGMDPNRALVFMLQLRGDRLVDRETVQKHLPFDVDLTQLQQNVDAEELRDALKAGLLAYVQAIGPMASQGQDPKEILTVLSGVIAGRQKGKALEDLALDAFQRLEQQKQAAMQAAAEQQAAAGGGGEGAPGVQPSGLLDQVAAGQAGQAPGGRPSIQTLMASMGATGAPTLNAGVRRTLPA